MCVKFCFLSSCKHETIPLNTNSTCFLEVPTLLHSLKLVLLKPWKIGHVLKTCTGQVPCLKGQLSCNEFYDVRVKKYMNYDLNPTKSKSYVSIYFVDTFEYKTNSNFINSFENLEIFFLILVMSWITVIGLF